MPRFCNLHVWISQPLTTLLEILRNSSTIFRSTHRRWSIKKAFPKHFVIFTRNHLCWDLFFKKDAPHQSRNFIKGRLQRRLFLMNIREFIITPGIKNFVIFAKMHLCWILFLINPPQLFSCEYCGIFKSIYWKTSANGCFWNLMKVFFDFQILSF